MLAQTHIQPAIFQTCESDTQQNTETFSFWNASHIYFEQAIYTVDASLTG